MKELSICYDDLDLGDPILGCDNCNDDNCEELRSCWDEVAYSSRYGKRTYYANDDVDCDDDFPF